MLIIVISKVLTMFNKNIHDIFNSVSPQRYHTPSSLSQLYYIYILLLRSLNTVLVVLGDLGNARGNELSCIAQHPTIFTNVRFSFISHDNIPYFKIMDWKGSESERSRVSNMCLLHYHIFRKSTQWKVQKFYAV